MDLLKRDWERALERHSEKHPVTFNGNLWTTTSQARRLVDRKNADRKRSLCATAAAGNGLQRPLRQRRQLLTITKARTRPLSSRVHTVTQKTTMSILFPPMRVLFGLQTYSDAGFASNLSLMDCSHTTFWKSITKVAAFSN